MEWPIQTSDPDTVTGSEDKEDPQAHDCPTTRELVPQEIFKPARQQKERWDSQVIEFSVYGEEGIRLSDALEGNWAGFEGRDDRSLFGDGRNQIMVRLHVRPPAIVHTPPRWLILPSSSSSACRGNRRWGFTKSCLHSSISHAS